MGKPENAVGKLRQTSCLHADLQRRASETGKPTRIGLIGCGEMGTDIVTQCVQMPGIAVAAIADNHLSNGYKALAIAGRTAGTHAEAACKANSTPLWKAASPPLAMASA